MAANKKGGLEVAKRVGCSYPFRRLLLAQIGAIVLAAAGAGVVGLAATVDAVMAATVCGVANFYAAWRAFGSDSGDGDGDSGLRALAILYRAEFGKLLLIGAMSAAIFAARDVNLPAYVGGCIAAILAGIGVSASFRPNTKRKHVTLTKNHYGQ